MTTAPDGVPPNFRSASVHPVAAIVGAGIAGLTAAYRLKSAGWDVKVFESEAKAVDAWRHW